MKIFPRARRGLLYGTFAFAPVVTSASPMSDERLPIVFVHGNGDSAALWHTTLWRFESNGYDRSLLHAIDLAHPAAPRRDSVREENRSSTLDQTAQLADFVTRVRRDTHRDKVVLIGSSRGGNTIRSYVKRAGGHSTTALAILCGTPNHGVVADARDPDVEWSGTGDFLSALNAGTEVHPDVRFVTLRSDTNDKYAQPHGPFVGPAGAGYASPELDGATNVVLPGLDHREVAFHPTAFRELYRAVTGEEPEHVDIMPETNVRLNGLVSGYVNGEPTNLPLGRVRVRVFEVDNASGERRGAVAHEKVTGSDGLWGPFEADPLAYYEFVIEAPDYPVTHVYRTPFPRSSRFIHLRLVPLSAWAASADAGSLVAMTRPRGFLGHGRDVFTIDGSVPEGVNEGVPGTSTATRAFEASSSRSVPVVLNGEAMVVRTWPLSERHVTIAEFHY